MDGSLRLSGRSTGVDHQTGIQRPHHLGRSIPFVTFRDLVPPDVSLRLHRGGAIAPLKNKDRLEMLQTLNRFICMAFQIESGSSSISQICRKQTLCTSILKSLSHRGRCVAAENGDEDCTDFHRCQHGDGHLCHHRHQTTDPVPRLDSPVAQSGSPAVDLIGNLRKGPAPDGAVLLFTDQCQPIRSLCSRKIHTIQGKVGSASDKPVGPFWPSGQIENLLIGSRPDHTQILQQGVPKCFRFVLAPFDQLRNRHFRLLGVQGSSQHFHPAGNLTAFDHIRIRRPDRLHDASPSRATSRRSISLRPDAILRVMES